MMNTNKFIRSPFTNLIHAARIRSFTDNNQTYLISVCGTYQTLEENALIQTMFWPDEYCLDCFMLPIGPQLDARNVGIKYVAGCDECAQ